MTEEELGRLMADTAEHDTRAVNSIWDQMEEPQDSRPDAIRYRGEFPPEAYIQSTCNLFRIGPEELLARRQDAIVQDVRAALMHVCRDELTMTLTDIAKLFKRHHTTVLAGINRSESNERFGLVEKIIEQTKLDNK